MSPAEAPLLAVSDLVQEFEVRGRGGVRAGVVQAVSGVSFEVQPGETLGIVGETGSGKSTLARAVLQAPRPRSGSVVFRGADLVRLRGRSLLEARRQLQMVFQDPYASLDPSWRVEEIVSEPLVAHRVGDRASRRRRAAELLDLVRLDPRTYGHRRPRELSGGECQRVAIARALAGRPAIILADEPTGSLDSATSAGILTLLGELNRRGATILVVTHNPEIAEAASRVIRLRDGRVEHDSGAG